MAAKSLSSLTHISILRLRPRLSRPLLFLSPLSTHHKTSFPLSHFLRPFSVTATLYPLQYEMIVSRPVSSTHPKNRRRPPRISNPDSDNFSDPEKPDEDLGLDGWVDQKLANDKETDGPRSGIGEMDRAKRKYYNKRRKRMYGSDSDDGARDQGGSVELNPQIVEFNSLQEREEALFLHDTFAYPWEKDKHYRMVHELEKKYYPNQSLDNAFLQPGESNKDANEKTIKGRVKKLASRFGGRRSESEVGDEIDDKGLIFFEEKGEEKGKKELAKDASVSGNVMKKKAYEPFKKIHSEHNQASEGEPYLLTRSTELPPRWDSPFGTVVLVNKPKGWTSFTVCGKLRRLVNVKKVGHAGTLDPMATGLLIVCVGKATKLADKYQGMIKGYSGVFRLGEATSTWDADSPVIQRESWEHIKDDDIKKAVSSFLGEIWQVPPMFSAIKVNGEKMYDKARRGESIELAPRRISIFQFDIERSTDDRQDLIFQVICSKGTYIRSLCADLGKALGSCAHLTALRRDSIGEYTADNAWDFSELEDAIRKQ